MTATTAQSVVPTPRPGGEAQIAAVPGYYLSESVQENPQSSPIGQAAVMLEPGDLIGLPGLALGGRYVGSGDSGGYPEPMLRYRTHLDDQEVFAVGGVVFGAYGHGSSDGASYEATRGGAEAGVDVRATPKSKWVELHLFGNLGFTGLDANGDYCLDADGRWGVDCGDAPVALTHAKASGFFPSAAGGLALDLARHLHGILHGGHIALHGAVGRMPHVESGQQTSGKTFTSAGLSLTLGLGASE
jgi:hypothetical protein